MSESPSCWAASCPLVSELGFRGRLRHSALTHDAEDGTSTPMLLARSRHASVRPLERYAWPGVDAVAQHVAERDPAARRRSKPENFRCASRTTPHSERHHPRSAISVVSAAVTSRRPPKGETAGSAPASRSTGTDHLGSVTRPTGLCHRWSRMRSAVSVMSTDTPVHRVARGAPYAAADIAVRVARGRWAVERSYGLRIIERRTGLGIRAAAYEKVPPGVGVGRGGRGFAGSGYGRARGSCLSRRWPGRSSSVVWVAG
jgi:hypothetical protein